MRPRLSFYPVGNADCCLVQLADGRNLILDFAAPREAGTSAYPCIDLPQALRKDLKGRNCVDVLAVSHRESDRCRGIGDFFQLEHSPRYQGPRRIKVIDLWVTVGLFTDPDLKGDAKAVQAEARYRLRNGQRVRVFGHPTALQEWFEEHGMRSSSRDHLITDAGSLVPGFSFNPSGVEIFVHSPFAEETEEGNRVMRNSTSLALHMTFDVGGRAIRAFFGADLDYQDLTRIVSVSERNENSKRLLHDIVKVPGHCNFLALGPEKGEAATAPVAEVRRFYETCGLEAETLLSSSNAVHAAESNGPPHHQAAAYYSAVAKSHRGEFVVTMEHPNRAEPDVLRVFLGESGAMLSKVAGTGLPIGSSPAPRAG